MPERYVPKHTVDEAKDLLKPFLEMHPSVEISRFLIGPEGASGELNQLSSPWDDPTLILFLPNDLDVFAPIINSLYLPRSLSALWHQDSHDLEIIWTAYRLSKPEQEIGDRAFKIIYNGKRYTCEFKRSSKSLLALSETIVPRSNPSSTNFRNMQSFKEFTRAQASKKRNQNAGLDKPRSFFIRNVRLKEAAALELIRHINFYMTYYDAFTPTVLIHHENSAKFNDRKRYIADSFPSEIRARPLDENLLSFWDSAVQAESNILRFILHYRVIEYAAFHYIENSVRDGLKRIVSDAALCMNTGAAIERILEQVDYKKSDEINLFNKLVCSQIDCRPVWREIEANKEAFCTSTKFDGGFTLERLIDKDEKYAGFSVGGMLKFAGSIRNVRNVLSHGKDQNSGKVIIPSERNLNLLKPWVNAITAVSGQVVMYEAVPK